MFHVKQLIKYNHKNKQREKSNQSILSSVAICNAICVHIRINLRLSCPNILDKLHKCGNLSSFDTHTHSVGYMCWMLQPL
jgi:hypothetical protein